MPGIRRKCAGGFRGIDPPRWNCGCPCSSFIGKETKKMKIAKWVTILTIYAAILVVCWAIGGKL